MERGDERVPPVPLGQGLRRLQGGEGVVGEFEALLEWALHGDPLVAEVSGREHLRPPTVGMLRIGGDPKCVHVDLGDVVDLLFADLLPLVTLGLAHLRPLVPGIEEDDLALERRCLSVGQIQKYVEIPVL